MKVRLARIVQDPLIGEQQNLSIERFEVTDDEEVLLDGPVCERLAVIDFDTQRGELTEGARLKLPPPGRVRGRYEVDEDDPFSRHFNQVSVFATVLRTMRLYEERDALGRALTWAFGAPQLLVLPRAGERTSAFYQRETHSLQFFHFPSQRPEQRGRTVYSSLSQDIVAHETGHAILDGIAPDLYHAITPQSLGLHEAIGDLTALLMAFDSRVLRKAVLEETGGSIRRSDLFSSLAEEYAQGKDRLGRVGFLRSLDNQKTLDPDAEPENRVSRSSPHELSQVLTGALYPLMLELYEERQRLEVEKTGRDPLVVSGKSLWVAAQRFKRMLLRALDYLPPGEVSFADYGRAILASDQASHPDDDTSRSRIRDEFARRHVVGSETDLELETDFEHEAVADLDLATLVESDWAAYEFAGRHRDLLGIPADRPFRVRPAARRDQDLLPRRGPAGRARVHLQGLVGRRGRQLSASRRSAQAPGHRRHDSGSRLAEAPDPGPAQVR